MFDFLISAETIHQFAAEDLQIALMADQGEFAGTVAEERMQGAELLTEMVLFLG